MPARPCALVVCAALTIAFPSAADPSGADPLLVVLQPTGSERDGLPVYTRHPDPAAVEAVLSRGFSGRLLRLYRLHQSEPAYLLLSENQGGFPRFGFVLDDEPKPEAGYVDLHRSSDLSGSPGAVDQIFPHELLHVIVRQLAGERRAGGSNQVHAVGVRTDPETAFEEGFAEHAQVMAVDDPEAVPETRAIADDGELRAWADRKFDAYARTLAARVSAGSKARITFPLWFGRAEQTLRYHGVRENLFSLARPLPPRLRSRRDPYAAYLFENVVPGRPGDPGKPLPLRLSTEGVVASLFVRWMSEPGLRGAPDDGDPLDGAYLKVFEAIRRGRPATTREFVRAYVAAFPEETDAVRRVVAEVFGPDGPSMLDPGRDAPELWVRNVSFRTGTTVYDQLRGLPREHTFDLNAATLTDLMSVPGVDERTAEAIRSAAPFRTVTELKSVARVAPGVAARIETMAAAAVRASAEDLEEETSLQLAAILYPFLWRALLVLIVSAMAGALAYRTVREAPWWRAALAGFGAAAVALPVGWIFDPGAGLMAWSAPVLLFGVPGSAWRARKERGWSPALRVLAAWLAATLPSFAAIRPWF